MLLYSYKGATPIELPNRIRLSNGVTRTDKTTFTSEEITDAGWFLVPKAPVAEHPNKVVWSGENKEWVVRAPNEAETSFKRQQIKDECDRRLAATDYKVIKSFENSEPVDPVYATYRQELRDLYNNVNDVDPWTVEYPVLVIETDEEASANTP